MQGGQSAADDFMTKVREYLVSLGPAMKDAKTIPVIVKAYANLSGLAQACMRDKKVGSVGDMGQFWCGFTRRYPLVDFVDVGAGKEEADNKLRGTRHLNLLQNTVDRGWPIEVLAFHIANPQCEHILLACCHDAGYVPVLRQYAAQATLFERMTLLSAGAVQPDIGDLGFRTTRIFDSLFGHSGPPRVTPTATNGKNVQMPPVTVQQIVDLITRTPSLPQENLVSNPVSNSGRLRPIIRNNSGKRIDKRLNVEESLIQAMKKRNLCSWHYLRADCLASSCKRNHTYPRPLSPAEYDAQWCIARHGLCYRLRRGGNCDDDQCMYGHGPS
jgi:hypothetical protein